MIVSDFSKFLASMADANNPPQQMSRIGLP
jgi:hypothetical protein